MIYAIHRIRYCEIKCFFRLRLKNAKDGANFSEFGSKFQYLGPLDASELTLQDLRAFITNKLPYLLLRVEY